MYKYAILSDIHGNLFALTEVINDLNNQNIDSIILLGDLIDYGMQSNEVIDYIKDNLSSKIICNIWGNHEKAIMTPDFNHFSNQRGIDSAKFTLSQLTDDSKAYLNNELIHEGKYEFNIADKKVLAIHGSLIDYYWKAISPNNLNGDYSDYDVILSGHSHYPHVFQHFYQENNPDMRNKKSVLFINPGSVGQPRNHNPNAQYAILDLDSMGVELRSIKYPNDEAMDLYDGSVDDFYRLRLENGI
ncbi:metallophosphoesterase [Methanobrevibacter sp.]|uniref:metallophosphoesterase family protein n=1 Tax=Methanobrevibacter sp. TaxID=66852 RepID=UPI0025D3976C|nr:metallophosphoesterase family protein [Methanobrevibacter sp.]MEE0943630.1 metallophosphoesterase family protein [Methanobrevibacter sp.]